MVVRIARLDEWGALCWGVLVASAISAGGDRIVHPTKRALALGLGFFGALSFAVAYFPDLWFAIAFRLNHAEHYWWNANAAMKALPGNDGRFLWSHRWPPLAAAMAWVYRTGFDMVVWYLWCAR